VTPLGFAMLAIVQSGTTGGAAPRWAWVMHPPARGAATAIAILLLLGGLVLAARVDARDVHQAGAS
jgi:hypothetical protein